MLKTMMLSNVIGMSLVLMALSACAYVKQSEPEPKLSSDRIEQRYAALTSLACKETVRKNKESLPITVDESVFCACQVIVHMKRQFVPEFKGDMIEVLPMNPTVRAVLFRQILRDNGQRVYIHCAHGGAKKNATDRQQDPKT